MDQEITQPERTPQTSSQATSTLGCFIAAAGATLLAASMLTAAMGATVWAVSNLIGFPQYILWALLALSLIPSLWATIWTAGRAWHVERRLAQGLDIDIPVFKLLHYWRKDLTRGGAAMPIWNRILEAIAAAGNSIAAYLSGGAVEPENSIAFTIGLIGLSAKMAKADGVVTHDEVAAFRQILEIAPEEMENVARVFNLAKQDVAGFESYARQLARLFAGKREMLEDVLDGLFHIAKADGVVHERELAYLNTVAGLFGFSEAEFRRVLSRHHAGAALTRPYDILGADPAMASAELRALYLKLVREHHPDRHIAAGMPEEAVKIATDRLAKINAAYDTIARERGL